MTFIRKALLLLLLVSVAALASGQDAVAPPAEERSRSPFTTSPADIAVEEPCRFIGTFHKESRQRLEELRAAKVISLDEWACMARALKSLDEEMTVKCKEKKESIEVIEAWQTERYLPCVVSEQKEEIVRCSLLSSLRDESQRDEDTLGSALGCGESGREEGTPPYFGAEER